MTYIVMTGVTRKWKLGTLAEAKKRLALRRKQDPKMKWAIYKEVRK
jgi:hypothetical protein